MTTIEYIRAAAEASRNLTIALLDDMAGAPLTFPTPNGGNHPLWVLGHLTYSESNLIHHIIGGEENPLIGWKQMFGSKSEPVADPAKYLPWNEVRLESDKVRAHTLAVLDAMTDADLAKPSKNCPPGREQVMGTVGGCLTVVVLHPALHRGQVADARRALGRPPVFG